PAEPLFRSKNPMSRSQKLKHLFNKFICEVATDDAHRKEMQDIFVSICAKYNVFLKLDTYDSELSSGRTNNRDLKSKEYIKEILESHIVNNKIDLCNKIEHVETKLKNNKIELIQKIKDAKNKLKLVEEERIKEENQYQRNIDICYETLK
ncbi:hypothetical protein SLOPH_525, partial [Spraguea lophii 42_110]